MNAPTVYAPCAHCGRRMATNHDANGRPRLYCSDVCRQRACRARHKTIADAARVGNLNPSTAGSRPTGNATPNKFAALSTTGARQDW